MADIVVSRMNEQLDEMLNCKKVTELFGFKKTYIYENAARLGGVKAGGKWFFSKNNLNRLIKHGML